MTRPTRPNLHGSNHAAAQQPSREHSPRHNDTTTVDGLRVACVGEEKSRRQALVFMGIMAWIEPFELQRMALLARAWKARVTVVDVPGCGHGGARLTAVQRRALRRGEFCSVARQMVHTAQAHNPRLQRGTVTVVGYSLGASLAAAAAADPGLLRVSNLILVEPVALRRWRVPSLLRAVRRENHSVDEFVDRNHCIPDFIPLPHRRSEPMPPWSRVDVGHLGYAISRGQLAQDLLRANVIQGCPVQLVHGVNSTLSRPADVAGLVRRCRRVGVDVHDVPVAGRHALWHSLTDVGELAARTGELLE